MLLGVTHLTKSRLPKLQAPDKIQRAHVVAQAFPQASSAANETYEHMHLAT